MEKQYSKIAIVIATVKRFKKSNKILDNSFKAAQNKLSHYGSNLESKNMQKKNNLDYK